ncbi:MAG: hypothetical protein KIC94_20615 [Clostridiales bacterium]|nr:hypothetical protein [Clostridiales bacterium]
MTLREAIDSGVMIVNNDDSFSYNGMCKDCKHSKCYSSPALSNMCMNKKSEWHGSYHVDHNLMRYVDGCSVFDN